MNKIILLTLALLSIIIGGFFFALNNNIIIIRYPHHTPLPERTPSLDKQLMRFSYWKNMQQHHEWRHILKDENDLVTTQRIITMYWLVLEDYGILTSRIAVQSLTVDRTGKTIICSLSHNPCSTEHSVVDAWLMLEGLLNTLHELMPQFHKIWFLVNHQPLEHPLLNCSRPWPLEGFSSVAEFATTTQPAPHLHAPRKDTKKEYTVYVNPAGSPYNPGRTIHNQFERGIALSCAQALKEALAPHAPHLRVVINPARDDTTQLHTAVSHAHRVQADLYLHLGFFQSQQPTPELIITTFQWHPATDLWKREPQPGEFVPLAEAHKMAAAISTKIAQHMFRYAQTTRPFPLMAHARIALPYSPLVGLSIPALGFEIGITTQQSINDIAPALAVLIQDGLDIL